MWIFARLESQQRALHRGGVQKSTGSRGSNYDVEQFRPEGDEEHCPRRDDDECGGRELHQCEDGHGERYVDRYMHAKNVSSALGPKFQCRINRP